MFIKKIQYYIIFKRVSPEIKKVNLKTIISDNYPVGFILWNFFLLAIPFFLFFILRRYEKKNGLKKRGQKLIAWLIGLFWLLFLPNAAYVILDVRHYYGECFNNNYKLCAEKNWQILFFFIYGSIGWLAYVYLLNMMKAFIADIKNIKIADYFIAGVIPIMSLGVLLGMNNRLNTWDVLFRPELVLVETLSYFSDLSRFGYLIAFSFFYYILYFLGNYFFRKPY